MMLKTGSELVSWLAGQRVNGLAGSPNPFTRSPVHPHTKHGFTLIEVMIAVSILAVGIIGILHAYVAAINGFSAGRAGIDAAFLLKEKIGDVEKDMLEKKDMLPGACEGEFGESKNGFRWRLEIKPVDFGVEELKDCLNEATLTVSNGRTNQSRSFSVTTYMESNEPVKK